MLRNYLTLYETTKRTSTLWGQTGYVNNKEVHEIIKSTVRPTTEQIDEMGNSLKNLYRISKFKGISSPF